MWEDERCFLPSWLKRTSDACILPADNAQAYWIFEARQAYARSTRLAGVLLLGKVPNSLSNVKWRPQQDHEVRTNESYCCGGSVLEMPSLGLGSIGRELYFDRDEPPLMTSQHLVFNNVIPSLPNTPEVRLKDVAQQQILRKSLVVTLVENVFPVKSAQWHTKRKWVESWGFRSANGVVTDCSSSLRDLSIQIFCSSHLSHLNLSFIYFVPYYLLIQVRFIKLHTIAFCDSDWPWLLCDKDTISHNLL